MLVYGRGNDLQAELFHQTFLCQDQLYFINHLLDTFPIKSSNIVHDSEQQKSNLHPRVVFVYFPIGVDLPKADKSLCPLG